MREFVFTQQILQRDERQKEWDKEREEKKREREERESEREHALAVEQLKQRTPAQKHSITQDQTNPVL